MKEIKSDGAWNRMKGGKAVERERRTWPLHPSLPFTAHISLSISMISKNYNDIKILKIIKYRFTIYYLFTFYYNEIKGM